MSVMRTAAGNLKEGDRVTLPGGKIVTAEEVIHTEAWDQPGQDFNIGAYVPAVSVMWTLDSDENDSLFRPSEIITINREVQ